MSKHHHDHHHKSASHQVNHHINKQINKHAAEFSNKSLEEQAEALQKLGEGVCLLIKGTTYAVSSIYTFLRDCNASYQESHQLKKLVVANTQANIDKNQ